MILRLLLRESIICSNRVNLYNTIILNIIVEPDVYKLNYINNFTRRISMKQEKMYLGKAIYINNGIDIANIFFNISQEDEKTSEVLCEKGYYNQSVYFCIQSMEKYIKFFICKKVDISNKYFADKIRETRHSIDILIDFLIEIVAGNDNLLREQISNQIKNQILHGVKLSRLYNAVRYPFYNEYNKSYKFLKMSLTDCKEIHKMFESLKKMLQDLGRI